jgi:type 1 glutamine amidotransferase
MLLARLLNENMPNVEAVVYKHAWPEDPKAFDGAASVIIFTDGDRGHPVIKHREQVDALSDKGVGIGFMHWGVEVPKGQPGDDFLKWIGGYFETNWSVNPEWVANVTPADGIEVTRGVHPFSTKDEWYFNMRFRPNMEGVMPVLSAVPPDTTRKGRDGIRSGNPTVRAGIGKNQAETLVWVSTRGPNDARGFGCAGAHYHVNWAQDDFRKAILNCIVWTAHIEISKDGVPSKTPTLDELLVNQDKKVPANLNRERMQKQIDEMNHPLAPTTTPSH